MMFLHANATKTDVETSLAFNRCFLPGRRIDMSMIFDDGSRNLSSCPGCKMVTAKTDEELDLQVQWWVLRDHLLKVIKAY